MGTGSRFVAALLALALSSLVPAAERPHIGFAEKIVVTPGTARVQFDAYGRRFALNLRSNDRALGRLSLKQRTSIAGTRLWRGTLEGQSGSWVRLTESGGASEGVIWDGHDLYVVTRYENIASSLGAPLTAKAGDTVIFRLSDSTNLLPSGYCGTGPSPDGLASNNGLVQYRNMVAEMKIQSRMQAIAPSARQLEISMIADSTLVARTSDAMASMLGIYNIVDGIYAEQLGLLIVPADIRLIPAAGDPFTSTNPATLLGQLETYRLNTPAIASLGIAHLFTGLDLDGDIGGIARLGGACQATEAVSLTEGWLDNLSSALIMAHEIGHNLGADHDGTGACVTVPDSDSYLMSPTFNYSQRFSQCSLDSMNAFLATASCLAPAVYAKVELPRDSRSFFVDVDVPMTMPFDLHSTGTSTINGAKLDLNVHESFVLTATTPGVTCTPVPPLLSCDVGSIPAGEVRRVELTFIPGQQGYFDMGATVSASNNQNTRDTSQRNSINVRPNIDVSVAVATSTSIAVLGDMVDVTLTVRSLRTRTALDVRVSVSGGGLSAESFDAPAGVTCRYGVNIAGDAICSLGDIPGGETRTIVMHSRASQVVHQVLGRAYVTASNESSGNLNNEATFTMSVGAGHDVGLEDLMPMEPVRYNMPFEYRANLRSYGTESVDGVRVNIELNMQVPRALDSITSVTLGGNACIRHYNWRYECIVGTMAAGEVLPISIVGIATGVGVNRVTMDSYATVNDNPSNDRVSRSWIVLYGLDASLQGGVSELIEGVEGGGSFGVWSNGIQAANDAVLNVEFPEQVRLTRIDVSQFSTANCSIVDPRHLRCTYDFPPSSLHQSFSYYVISDVPGTYQATATLELEGDENPANNTLQFPVNVAAYIDAGVRRPETLPLFMLTGQDLTIPFEVFIGPRPVSDVSLEIFAQQSAEISSVSTGSGTCTRVLANQYTCALGDLPSGSVVNLSAVFTTTNTEGTAYFSASVSTPGDKIPNNNNAHASMRITATGDARVTALPTAITATAGTPFDLPGIVVSHQGPVVAGRLTITIPAGVLPVSLSGTSLVCSGSATIECSLHQGWAEGQEERVDLRLLAPAVGNYVITARVTAANDLTNTNDETRIAVTVSAAPPPSTSPPPTGGGGSSSSSSSSGGGGGGGGRIEWPIALLLGLLLVQRLRLNRASRASTCARGNGTSRAGETLRACEPVLERAENMERREPH